jgi:hypothetical protein
MRAFMTMSSTAYATVLLIMVNGTTVVVAGFRPNASHNAGNMSS